MYQVCSPPCRTAGCVLHKGPGSKWGLRFSPRCPHQALGPSTASGRRAFKNFPQSCCHARQVSDGRGMDEGLGRKDSSMYQGRRTACQDFLGSRTPSRSPRSLQPLRSLDPQSEPREGLEEVRGLACPSLGEEHSGQREQPIHMFPPTW